MQPAAAHLDSEELPPNADLIPIPEVIDLFEFIRFTRVDHRIVLDRIRRGDTHHVGTMSVALSELALTAGEINPRKAAKLVWDMAEIAEAGARRAYLMARSVEFRETLFAEEDKPAPDPDEVAALEALLALVGLWRRDPMDGSGS